MNIEMFLTVKEVEESLERRETATCLAWCHDNKSRLRKMKVRGGGAPGGAGPRRGGALPGTMEGLISIASGENTMQLKRRLEPYLPPEMLGEKK